MEKRGITVRVIGSSHDPLETGGREGLETEERGRQEAHGREGHHCESDR